MRCFNCDTENSINEKHCTQCGINLFDDCHKCGLSNPVDAQFCSGCGTSQQREGKYPPLAHTASPPQRSGNGLRQRIERKTISVLFVDIVGSTALVDGKDAEEAREIFWPTIRAMSDAVRRYGGTVTNEMGDGIMGVFGAPVMQADHAVRACLAALAIQEAVNNLSRRMEYEINSKFQIRIGINSGSAVVTTSSDPTQTPLDVTGPMVHLASRMESTADPGTINLSEYCFRRVETAFYCEPLAPRTVKGFSEPVSAYALIRRRNHSIKPNQPEGKVRTLPMVGRTDELATLVGCMDRLIAGQGSIVFVNGDPGIGKTRLIQELRNQLTPGTVQWLEGSALSYGEGLSYWPFMELIKCYLNISEADTESECWDKLEHRIWRMFEEESEEIIPYIATLLRLQIKPEMVDRVLHLGGETLGQQIMRASKCFFERMCEDYPTVLVFEDLHWMDGSSATLLEHLYSLIEATRLTVIVLSRNDEGGPTAECRRTAQEKISSNLINIDLYPLASEASMALVEHLLTDDARTVRLRRMIIYKSDGNPFFVEEVVRSLASANIVKRDATSGKWSAAGYLDEILIPDTIHDVIMARIDRIDKRLKDVLGIASVIGRTFLYKILKNITDEGYKLDESLSGLRVAELIAENDSDTDIEYIFKHALVHDSVYDSLLLRRRRDLHRAVGKFLENNFKDRLEEYYGLLAFHFSRAESWEKAQHYLFAAGDQASRLAADDEVLLHYESAVLAYQRAFGENLNNAQSAKIEWKLGETSGRRGNHDQAFEHFTQSLTHLGKTYPANNRQLVCAIAVETLRHISDEIVPDRWIEVSSDEEREKFETLGRMAETMSWLNFAHNPNFFPLDMLRMINWSRRAGRSEIVATGYSEIGFVLDRFGFHRFANRYHTTALELAEGSAHPRSRALANIMISHQKMQLGLMQEAHTYMELARDISWKAGELETWSISSRLDFDILCSMGENQSATEIADKMVQVGADSSSETTLRWGLSSQAELLTHTGFIDDGRTQLEEVLSLCFKARDYVCLTGTSAELGFCLLRQGAVDKAIETLENAREVLKQQKVFAHTIAMVATRRADAYLTQLELATTSKNWIMKRKARRACNVALKWARRYRFYLPRAMRHKGTYEWLVGRQDRAIMWFDRSIAMAEEIGTRHDLGLTYLEKGIRATLPEDVEKGREILVSIGVSHVQARIIEVSASQELYKRSD